MSSRPTIPPALARRLQQLATSEREAEARAQRARDALIPLLAEAASDGCTVRALADAAGLSRARTQRLIDIGRDA